MLGDAVVVDAAVHGFDFDPAHVADDIGEGFLHTQFHLPFCSPDPAYGAYRLRRENFERTFTPEDLVSCVLHESRTDIAVYHHVRRMGIYASSELSPLSAGLKARELAGPGRVLIFGALTDPFDTSRSIDELDELAEAHGVVGLKLYPTEWNSRTRAVEPFTIDDERVAFPLIEHAQKVGLKAVAVHKAIGSLIRAFGVGDMEVAAQAFPQMNFEVVHAGWSFMDDTLILATRPNVYLNLEITSALLAVAPRRFAHVIGRFLREGAGDPGAEDRITWASGAIATHPQPLLELFDRFTMPADLAEGHGYPPVTGEVKRKILGANYARMLGTDIDTLAAELDGGAPEPDLAPPWRTCQR